ncbi:hypothetical protein [Flaviaesturariibacter amylovorans]|uniref:Lipoprotein n=1 Tax=Flaviaesturariibacter amylovorans TaxID=1084520 RepID=A0ABP8HD87_9BACT
MKIVRLLTLALSAAFLMTSCAKTDIRNQEAAADAPQSRAIFDQTSGTWQNVSAYAVALESKVDNGNGTWTWTWSIRNTNPGNGNNGTIQNLSHWNMTLGSCVNFADIVSASTSYNGISYNSFQPTLAVDPSQNCVVTPVLKFNVSTSGSTKTYCRLVVKADYGVDNGAVGFYKSGARTGCGPLWFQGMGCLGGFDN